MELFVKSSAAGQMSVHAFWNEALRAVCFNRAGVKDLSYSKTSIFTDKFFMTFGLFFFRSHKNNVYFLWPQLTRSNLLIIPIYFRNHPHIKKWPSSVLRLRLQYFKASLAYRSVPQSPCPSFQMLFALGELNLTPLSFVRINYISFFLFRTKWDTASCKEWVEM